MKWISLCLVGALLMVRPVPAASPAEVLDDPASRPLQDIPESKSSSSSLPWVVGLVLVGAVVVVGANHFDDDDDNSEGGGSAPSTPETVPGTWIGSDEIWTFRDDETVEIKMTMFPGFTASGTWEKDANNSLVVNGRVDSAAESGLDEDVPFSCVGELDESGEIRLDCVGSNTGSIVLNKL